MTDYMTVEGALERAGELARRNTKDYYIAQRCDTKMQRFRVLTKVQYLKANVIPFRAMVSPEGTITWGAGHSGPASFEAR